MMKGEIVVRTLGCIVRGTAPKKHHLNAMLLLSIIYFIGIVISISFYPNQAYSPLSNYISDMGSIAYNPVAWWVFNLTEVFLGILMIPHFLYLYRRLLPTARLLTRLALISGIAGCIGFSWIGIIPEDFQLPHSVGAILAFAGFTTSALFTMLVFIRKIWLKSRWPSPRDFWILYGPLCVTLPLVFIMPNLAPLVSSLPLDLRWFTIPIWEWTFMVSLMYWIISVAIITPDVPCFGFRFDVPKINHPLQVSNHQRYSLFLRRHYIGNITLESG